MVVNFLREVNTLDWMIIHLVTAWFLLSYIILYEKYDNFDAKCIQITTFSVNSHEITFSVKSLLMLIMIHFCVKIGSLVGCIIHSVVISFPHDVFAKIPSKYFFTKELYYKLISRKFFEVGVNFRNFHTVCISTAEYSVLSP